MGTMSETGSSTRQPASLDAAASTADRGGLAAPTITLVSDMVPMLEWADLAVCAGGSTLWEMGAFGVPVACVILAENQAPIVADLERRGMVCNLGWDRDLEAASCSAALEALLEDGDLRGRMGAVGSRLVDGAGAARVAAALVEGS